MAYMSKKWSCKPLEGCDLGRRGKEGRGGRPREDGGWRKAEGGKPRGEEDERWEVKEEKGSRRTKR